MLIPLNEARLVIPTTFEDCLSYGEQVRWLYENQLKLDERIKKLEGYHNPSSGGSSESGGGESGSTTY